MSSGDLKMLGLLLLEGVMVSGGVWALLAKDGIVSAARHSPRTRTLMLAGWVVGGVLATLAVTVWWPFDRDARIVGFPLPGAIFERSGDGWIDFVGPTTLPFLMIDFVTCLLAPQILLVVYLKCVGGRHVCTGEAYTTTGGD